MSTPPFVDVTYAADMFHVSPDLIHDWLREGRLKAVGGKSSNPFVRTVDVAALAADIAPLDSNEPPKRVKSASTRVQTRLTADAKWAEVSDSDIRDWAQRADPARLRAARKAVDATQERLRAVLGVLDELEGSG